MTRSGHWRSLKHNGVAFPELYRQLGFGILIKGRQIQLSRESEEMVYAWAKKKDTPYVKDATFQANFLKWLKPNLPDNYQNAEFDISDVDFSEPFSIVDNEKSKKELMSKEEKKRIALMRKELREKLKQQYGYAQLDGEHVEVANWMVEPPGLFMGRGNHPLRGSWKSRISPREVTLNLSEDAQLPQGNWGRIIHDPKCMWLASWVDKLTNKVKYVWLAETTSLRQQRDKAKYDKATRLEGKIEFVRRQIDKMLGSRKPLNRKIATVCYLIDTLAMRVGDEKDEDEADTVGATTLRLEHTKLDGSKITFNFLGKDSVSWQKTVETGPNVIANFREFMNNKKPEDQIFDGVTSNMVNRVLNKWMSGLTAKVFRTYIATKAVRKYLHSEDGRFNSTDDFYKLHHAKMANLAAAIRSNHKRTPPKNFDDSLDRKEQRLQKLLASNPKTENARIRLGKSINKVSLQIELAKATRDYNLSTSLKNYIDPRVYCSWANQVNLDWKLIYTKALQRRFTWAEVK